MFLFFKQKTAYEVRISDWSSDVCSSDLTDRLAIATFTLRNRTRLAALRVVGNVMTLQTLLWPDEVREAAFPSLDESPDQIGRASCRERVCQYVYISVVAVTLQKKKQNTYATMTSILTYQ